MDDNYKRRHVDQDRYQCGCRWEKRDDDMVTGDVLVECPIHARATQASVAAFDKERSAAPWPLN